MQEKIEDYLLLSKTNPNRKSLLKEMQDDAQMNEQLQKTALLQEALLRHKVRESVTKAREEANSKQRKSFTWQYALPSTAIAASIALFFFLKPIDVGNPDETYTTLRGVNTHKAETGNTKVLLDAQKLVSSGQGANAIPTLEGLVKNANFRDYYHNRTLWLLAVAYLQNKQPKKAEETFNAIACEGDGCSFDKVDATKFKTQVFIDKLRFDE